MHRDETSREDQGRQLEQSYSGHIDLLMLAKHAFEQRLLSLSHLDESKATLQNEGSGSHLSDLKDESVNEVINSHREENQAFDLASHAHLIHSRLSGGIAPVSTLTAHSHGFDPSHIVADFFKQLARLPESWSLGSSGLVPDPTQTFSDAARLQRHDGLTRGEYDIQSSNVTSHDRTEQLHEALFVENAINVGPIDAASWNTSLDFISVPVSPPSQTSIFDYLTPDPPASGLTPAAQLLGELSGVAPSTSQVECNFDHSSGAAQITSQSLGPISGSTTAPSAIATSTTSVIVTATEQAPTIIGAMAGQATTDATALQPFGAVQISDPDFGKTETVTVTLDQPGNGVLGNLGGGSYDAAHGIYTASGSAAQVTADLKGLVFVPTAHEVAPGQSVTTGLVIAVNDGLGGSTSDATTSVIVTATEQAPTIIGAMAGQATTDATALQPFGAVQISDPDFGKTETVTVTLDQPGNGVLGNLGGGSYDAAHGIYTASGSAAQVTADLKGLVFVPTAHEVAPGQSVTTGLVIAVNDGLGGSTSDATTSVIVTATEQAPTIIGAMAGQATTDATALQPFGAVQISDPDFGKTETVTVTLDQPGNGVLGNLGGGSYDAAHGIYTASGSAAQVTADLKGLVFVPTAHEVAPGQSVTTGLVIAVNDGLGGSTSDATTSVIVTATEQAPTIIGAMAGQATTDATALQPFGAVQISDPDFGKTETVTVTLDQPGNGVLGNLGGGSYDAAHGIYTASGSAAQVTADLKGLVFVPTAHEVAPGQSVTTGLVIAVNDGLGGSTSDATTSVIVTATEQAPTIIGAMAGQATTDATALQPFGAVQISDPDFGKTETVTVTLDQPGNGVLGNLGGGSYDAAHGIYTASGSAAQVTADLKGLVFVPTAHEVAPGQSVTTGLVIAVNDGLGGSTSDATTSVIVTATEQGINGLAVDTSTLMTATEAGALHHQPQPGDIHNGLVSLTYEHNDVIYPVVSLPPPSSAQGQLRAALLNANWSMMESGQDNHHVTPDLYSEDHVMTPTQNAPEHLTLPSSHIDDGHAPLFHDFHGH